MNKPWVRNCIRHFTNKPSSINWQHVSLLYEKVWTWIIFVIPISTESCISLTASVSPPPLDLTSCIPTKSYFNILLLLFSIILAHTDSWYFKFQIPCLLSLVRQFKRILSTPKSYVAFSTILGRAVSSHPTPKLEGHSLWRPATDYYILVYSQLPSISASHNHCHHHIRLSRAHDRAKHNSGAARPSVTSNLNTWHKYVALQAGRKYSWNSATTSGLRLFEIPANT